MSATRQDWQRILEQIYTHMYELEDRWFGMSYEQAKPYIISEVKCWSMHQTENFVKHNFID